MTPQFIFLAMPHSFALRHVALSCGYAVSRDAKVIQIWRTQPGPGNSARLRVSPDPMSQKSVLPPVAS
jgi:hypothetical protein